MSTSTGSETQDTNQSDTAAPITGTIIAPGKRGPDGRFASRFNQETLNEILRRLAEGEPMANICRDPGMPNRDTVDDWRKKWKDVDEQIATARDQGEDAIAADCLAIADDGRNDWMEGEEGVYVPNQENIQRSKLRVWTRLQLLAKWNPRKYGDRVAHQALDENGQPAKAALVMFVDGVRK
jgi:hypothetical protein